MSILPLIRFSFTKLSLSFSLKYGLKWAVYFVKQMTAISHSNPQQQQTATATIA